MGNKHTGYRGDGTAARRAARIGHRLAALGALAAALLLAVPGGQARTDMPESLEAKAIGRYYVNIAVETGLVGDGLNEVFEATIMRVRPKTDSDLQAYLNFDILSGAGTNDATLYAWERNGNVYELYGFKGGEKTAVDVFVLMFPHEQRELNKLRILKANPLAYRDYNLGTELNALGIMGVTRKGPRNTVVFINGKTFPSTAKRPFAGVAIGNAANMLQRYAADNGFDGVETRVSIASRGTQGSFDEMISLMTESDVVKAVELRNQDDVNFCQTIAGFDLPKIKVRYEYVPCIPNGNNSVGSPRAAFFPIKLDGSFPVFVFPAALINKTILESAVRRELLHLQWWLAVANLQQGLALTPGENALSGFLALAADNKLKCILREGMLRTTVVHMEADIDAAMKSSATDALGADTRSLFFTHRYLFVRPLAAVMNAPQDMYEVSLPWTVSEDLIIPEKAGRLHFTGSVLYNNALYDILAITAPSLWQSIKEAAKSKVAGQKPSDDTRLVTGLFHSKASKSLGDKKDTIRKQLVDAILFGYANDHVFRSQLFSDSAKRVHDRLSAFLPRSYATTARSLYQDWVAAAGSATPSTDNLMVAALQQGYTFSDLEWLWILTQPVQDYVMPLQDLKDDIFGKRLEYLVKTQEVAYIRGMRLWQVYLKISEAELERQVALLSDAEQLLARLNDPNLQKDKTADQTRDIDTLRNTLNPLVVTIKKLGTDLTAKKQAYDALMKEIRDLTTNLLAHQDLAAEPALFRNQRWKPFEITWPNLHEVDLNDSGLEDLLATCSRIARDCDSAQMTRGLEARKNDLLGLVQGHNARIAAANQAIRLLIKNDATQLAPIDEQPLTGPFDSTKAQSLQDAIGRVETASQPALQQLLAGATGNYATFFDTFTQAMSECVGGKRKTAFDAYAADCRRSDAAICSEAAENLTEALGKSEFFAAVQTAASEKRFLSSEPTEKAQKAKDFIRRWQLAWLDYCRYAQAYRQVKLAKAEQEIIASTAEFCEAILKLQEQRDLYQAAADQAKRADAAMRTFVTERNSRKERANSLDAEIDTLNSQLAKAEADYRAGLRQARQLITLESVNDGSIAAKTVLSDLQKSGKTVQEKVQAAFYAFFGVSTGADAVGKPAAPDDPAQAFQKLKSDLAFLATVQFIDRKGGVK